MTSELTYVTGVVLLPIFLLCVRCICIYISNVSGLLYMLWAAAAAASRVIGPQSPSLIL